LTRNVSLLLSTPVAMKKETVSRFSVSLPPSLLRQLDEMSGEKGYDNRSLAIADMIRNHLVEHRQKSGNEDIAGTITLVIPTALHPAGHTPARLPFRCSHPHDQDLLTTSLRLEPGILDHQMLSSIGFNVFPLGKTSLTHFK